MLIETDEAKRLARTNKVECKERLTRPGPDKRLIYLLVLLMVSIRELAVSLTKGGTTTSARDRLFQPKPLSNFTWIDQESNR